MRLSVLVLTIAFVSSTLVAAVPTKPRPVVKAASSVGQKTKPRPVVKSSSGGQKTKSRQGVKAASSGGQKTKSRQGVKSSPKSSPDTIDIPIHTSASGGDMLSDNQRHWRDFQSVTKPSPASSSQAAKIGDIARETENATKDQEARTGKK
ncbi:hypothetical protein C8J56DRAFT_1171020 [Mycena floridula]|nr:hypothetical protein C8J56DRAFT_1171020 [Mycena floridula]